MNGRLNILKVIAIHAQHSFIKRKRLRDSILSPFFHSYIFAMYKNEALWI